MNYCQVSCVQKFRPFTVPPKDAEGMANGADPESHQGNIGCELDHIKPVKRMFDEVKKKSIVLVILKIKGHHAKFYQY